MSLDRFQRRIELQYNGETVLCRPLTAAEFVELNDRFAEITGDEDAHMRAQLEFYAQLLARLVLVPSATEKEWMQIPFDDLVNLAMCVLESVGLAVTVKKKSATGDGLPLTLPGSSDSQT